MLSIQKDYSLRHRNTFGVDAHARAFCEIKSESQLPELAELRAAFSELLILGEGSNVLFLDDYPGLVVQPNMKGMERIKEEKEAVLVSVGAGENWDQWVQYSLEQGWHGLENLSLIPGSVGAAPVQNIGAYGIEIQDFLHSLEAWDMEAKRMVSFRRNECRFSYRNSLFKNHPGRYLITRVTFRLSLRQKLNMKYQGLAKRFKEKGGSSAMDLRRTIIDIRSEKLPDPSLYGNAGSFFKNPLVGMAIFNCLRVDYPDAPFYPAEDNRVKIPAAWLLEKSGWKGKREGAVGTWPEQALVLVNYGGASGREIHDFSRRMLEDVDRNFGIELEREVTLI